MSTVALHHKYRPQILAELVGQPYIKTALTNAVKHLQIAPAYLLTGSRGTGKTSTARIFAKSLNCLNTKKPTDQPCGICQSCRSIESSNSLDVSEIDAASHNGVDDARTLIERCTLAPVAGRYRIFILDECLSGDSLVLTDSGWMRIDDPNIINKKALSYNEKTQQWEFKAITRHWSKGQRKTLVIKTATTEIRCTPEHLIRTENGWKKAESIQIGEKILVAPNTFLPKSDSIYSNLYDPFVLVDVEKDTLSTFLTKSTIVLDSQPRVVESGLNPSVNTQFQQWDTNSTSVESVHWSDLVEPVYDLEIADNHNFVANGLLVHNCHQLTTQSQNALLKCIEEPPPHVVFILCTTEQHKVLPTIISRCQVLNFRTLSVQAIVQHLRIVADAESITINDEALKAIARLSDGGLRDALQLLGQVRLLNTAITAHHVMEMAGGVTETELMAIFQAISTNNTFNLLQVARELVDSGKTPKLILANLLQTYRDLLIIKSAPQSQALLTGCLSHTQLTALAKHWNFDTLNLSLAELQKAESYLRSAVNAAVWLEVCLLNLMPGLLPVAATKAVNKPMYDKGYSGKLLPTFGVYTTNQVTAKPVDDQGDDRKLLPTVAANSSNLAQIWQQVLDTAKPSSQKLLSHAKLVKLQDNKAILEVTPAYLKKFEGNKQAIAKMLQRATQSQKPITVLIRTANYSNHGG
jgi:DNA polymerase III subunit gamma/tau